MFLYTLNLKIINIYKYINLFLDKFGYPNTSVRIGFGFGSLDTKILNPFGYLINFGSDSILLFRIEIGRASCRERV